MKPNRLILCIAVALAAAGASAMAEARPGFFSMGGNRDRGQADDRRYDARRDDAPRQWRDSREDPRRQRLSPEERRQLRRDVFDAGRDLYREEPPRRHGRW